MAHQCGVGLLSSFRSPRPVPDFTNFIKPVLHALCQRNSRHFLFFLCGLIFSLQGWCTPALVASPHLPFSLAVAVDPSGTWDLRGAQAQAFKTLPGQAFAGGYTHQVHWFRLRLPHQHHAAAGRLLLEIHPPYLDDVRLYVPGLDGQWRETRLGDRQPFSQRPIAYRGFVFPIVDLPPQADLLYLRLQTTSSSVMTAQLWSSPDAFAAKLSAEYAGIGIYFGVLLLLLVVNTLIVLQVPEALFRYYLLFLASSTLFVISTSGLWAEFVFTGTPAWGDYLTSLCGPLVFMAGGLFYQRMMLITRSATPWLFWLNLAFIVFSALTFIAIPLGYYTDWLALLIKVQMLVLLLWLLRAWQLWRQHQAPMGLLLAHVFTLLGTGAASLSLSGILPSEFWLFKGFQFGLMGAMLALQLVIATRVARLYQGQLQATTRAEMAEENNQHQRKLLSMLVHEVKTPLSIIRLALEAPQPSARLRQNAITSVQDICNVVDRCAESQKLSHGLQITWQSVDVAALLHQQLQQRPLAHRVDWSVPQTNSLVLSDSTCLQVIFSNLLSNADKYAIDGSTISIGMHGDADALHVVIANTAQPGCQPDPERLFEAYYRAAGALRVSGSGAGLFIVKSLVDHLQARIGYQLGALNRVSFTLSLPRQPHTEPTGKKP